MGLHTKNPAQGRALCFPMRVFRRSHHGEAWEHDLQSEQPFRIGVVPSVWISCTQASSGIIEN
jgi:hypothetical protein